MTPTATLWVRRILFCAFALWMLSGPIYRQVLFGENPYIREWRMYGMRAAQVCKTIYEQRDAEAWSPVSRWELEGFTFEEWPKKKTRLLNTDKAALRAGRRLCKKLPAGTQLRYRRRCGDPRWGWDEWITSEQLCAETR